VRIGSPALTIGEFRIQGIVNRCDAGHAIGRIHASQHP
jgi:hypothetical protein